MKRGPLTEKQKQATYRAAGRMYAAMAGVDPKPMDREPEPTLHKRTFAEQRVINATVRGEADVQREILQLLRHHPKVAIYERHNSGALPDARGRLVRFNRVTVNGKRGALISDITGHLKNGAPFAIECKAPGWTEPHWNRLQEKDWLTEKDAREMGQKMYLDSIRAMPNGIGIFATDVQDVINALKGGI